MAPVFIDPANDRFKANESPSPRRGFTVLEVMVVVAIVAILIAVLTPALRGAKERVNQVQCASNLRQIGLAMNAYLNDHKDTFPPCADYVTWRGTFYEDKPDTSIACALNGYIGERNATGTNNMGSKVWVCQTAEKFAWQGNPPGSWAPALPDPPYYLGAYGKKLAGGGYKHNITYRYNSKPTRGRLSMNGPGIGIADAYPQFAHRLKLASQAAIMWDLPDELGKPALINKYHRTRELHGDGVNCLFVDGRVAQVPVAYNFAGTQGLDVPGTLWWYASEWKNKGWDGAKVPGTDQP